MIYEYSCEHCVKTFEVVKPLKNFTTPKLADNVGERQKKSCQPNKQLKVSNHTSIRFKAGNSAQKDN